MDDSIDGECNFDDRQSHHHADDWDWTYSIPPSVALPTIHFICSSMSVRKQEKEERESSVSWSRRRSWSDSAEVVLPWNFRRRLLMGFSRCSITCRQYLLDSKDSCFQFVQVNFTVLNILTQILSSSQIRRWWNSRDSFPVYCLSRFAIEIY